VSYPDLSFCKDMRSDLLPHPCSGRVRDVPVPDSERELKPLKISLKIYPPTPIKPCIHKHFIWRRGSESVYEEAEFFQKCHILRASQALGGHYFSLGFHPFLYTVLYTVGLGI
jgi:hypothetical protein